MTFKELGLNDFILQALEKNQFNQPTEIQEKSIPIFLNNQNLFGKSSTGTGKTASFVLPILQKIEIGNKTPQVLILVPTRELALQILDETRRFSSMMENISVVGLIGGARLSEQIQKLKKSQIVVGTPGRVNDHINRKTLKLNKIHTIILDEADEMLKLGFKEEIDRIFLGINEDVQIGLFSATMNPKTMELANKYMKEYELVEVKNQTILNQNINNTFIVTKGYQKEDVLFALIQKHHMKKFIIFTNTKANTKKIAQYLTQKNIQNEIINGDLRQKQRTKVIKDFKNEKFQALIATDVVARGIHIDDIDYVINFEIPIDDEYFVHRIGRTGRNQQTGSTITLVNSYNLMKQLNFIIKKFHLEISEEFLDNEELAQVEVIKDERVEKKQHNNRRDNKKPFKKEFSDRGKKNFSKDRNSNKEHHSKDRNSKDRNRRNSKEHHSKDHDSRDRNQKRNTNFRSKRSR